MDAYISSHRGGGIWILCYNVQCYRHRGVGEEGKNGV